IGAGATALVDLWSLARRRLMHTPLPDYGLVGRWIAWLPRGRFRHRPIAATPAVRGELLIGWAAHYGIGVAFAAALIAIRGGEWLPRAPPPPPPRPRVRARRVLARPPRRRCRAGARRARRHPC